MEQKERFIKLNNKLFYSFNDFFSLSSDLIGNKSYNTFLLKNNNFHVPNSIATAISFFDLYVNNKELFYKKIDELKYFLEDNNITNNLSVRSSAIILNNGIIHKEDSSSHSMAGWFHSEINVPFEKLTKAVEECFNVAYSDLLNYRIKKHFNGGDIKIPLLIQEYFPALKSAVVFTKNPYIFNRGEFLINASYGACHGIVSGEVNSDTYILSPLTGKLIKKIIVKKDFFYTEGQTNNLRKKTLENSLKKSDTLSEGDLNDIFKLGKDIENLFLSPQDIEIIYDPKRGWCPVQTRNIPSWSEK